MTRKKRKIGFYYLTISSDSLEINDAFKHVCNLISSKDKRNRRFYFNDNNKFGILDSIQSFNQETRYRLLFKSAVHNFRPPLIDSVTVDERDSPKRLREGERDMTHLVVKFINGDAILVLEKFQGGLNINQIVKYLNQFSSELDLEESFTFSFEAIVKDDFLEELNSLNRVIAADVFVDKQLLGSAALNYSQRISSVKHEVVISVKAKVKDSIADFARDVYAAFNGGQNSVRRIRLIGKNEENNEVKINTDFIEKQEYVNPVINDDTGEINSNEIFIAMETVLQNYN